MIINGKVIAQKIQESVKKEIEDFGIRLSLTVIQVGNNPASELYIKKKRLACCDVGINFDLLWFPEDVSEKLVKESIFFCESDGILVQLPLPSSLNKYEILNKVPPEKDVDCFNAVNIGKLAQGIGLLKPCTPSGILEILKHYQISTKGKRVTIINRSQVIGQPLALMLQQEPYNATVTVCHEYTENLSFHTLNSDIVITAVGKYPGFKLHPQDINADSTVIDVAINRMEGKVFGDVVNFDEVKAKYITKVPGCVGPITVACLLRNTLIASKDRYEISV